MCLFFRGVPPNFRGGGAFFGGCLIGGVPLFSGGGCLFGGVPGGGVLHRIRSTFTHPTGIILVQVCNSFSCHHTFHRSRNRLVVKKIQNAKRKL